MSRMWTIYFLLPDIPVMETHIHGLCFSIAIQFGTRVTVNIDMSDRTHLLVEVDSDLCIKLKFHLS